MTFVNFVDMSVTKKIPNFSGKFSPELSSYRLSTAKQICVSTGWSIKANLLIFQLV